MKDIYNDGKHLFLIRNKKGAEAPMSKGWMIIC
jgi:hypothetical protein